MTSHRHRQTSSRSTVDPEKQNYDEKPKHGLRRKRFCT
ncbi:unnamed protein product, partial [Adineta ricciae]